ncbi:Aldehyde dehydrogenase, an ethanol-utilization protein (second step) [Frankia alni ACN14a]|uniref:Aldehyde dehydrogenase, an ethanol-utilization protein (Second step) n=1 Tax=Frankia alni (strain DSM 45986 / CECT 9034 / ACN14a) TaxID=326424 RepID=Q0RMH3_FRAAA|nr:Aldehyde dehydrogenase, an ethanol-utilization protein (second step) [Frankia alni ACN14a]
MGDDVAHDEYEGRLFIGGSFREARSGRRFDVVDPCDESVVATAADADAEDVSDAVAAARDAADTTSWATDHELRQRCLQQLQVGLRKETQEIRALQMAEAGICSSVLDSHVEAQIENMSWFNDLIGRFPWETDFPAFSLLGMQSLRRVRYEPYGVVGAITPWNAPFMTDLWKVDHALATGNTVVLKTAPDTPLSGAALARIVAEHTEIPAGVVNVISSADKAIAGEALTADPRVDMFHFTGSPAVGRRIAERAAVGIRKACLELGGKSANLILDDADLDQATGLGVAMCMSSSGQGCALATRMVVHASVYDEVLERLAAIVGVLPWGDPRDSGNVVGPIIRREQLDRMAALVDRARDAGARVLVGGERGDRGGKGFWYLPTVVADVGEDDEIAQTEVFGPVLTVVRYDGDDDEAVRVANNSVYGLSGYVQTSDPERAWRIARRLRTGTVNLGPAFYLSPDTPFGGYGVSGVGREHGEDGFREYLQAKTIAYPQVSA